MFHCSVINVLRCLSDSFCILSCCFCFVKNFFNFFFEEVFQFFFAASNSDILSCCFEFVKNFFHLFWRSFFSSLFLTSNFCMIPFIFLFVNNFFYFFQVFIVVFFKQFFPNLMSRMLSLTFNGEGGIWTLARRKPSIPLAGAPLQPLEYFSKLISFAHIS